MIVCLHKKLLFLASFPITILKERGIIMLVKAFVFSLLLTLAALNIQPAHVWADDTAATSEKAVTASNQNQQRMVDFAFGGCLFGLVVGSVFPGAGNVIGCALGALAGANLGK